MPQPAEAPTIFDPSHNLYRQHDRPLDAVFTPRSVAVIGASEREGTVGRTLLWNLISNPFGGTVYPVNPKRQNVLGIRAYPSLSEIPDDVDLAVIATPAPTVPGIIRECIENGVRGAIIISAGFKEIGEEGRRLEEEILEIAAEGRLRIIGPNCLGVMRPSVGLNATFANGMARPGSVAFVSQSGALLTAILDWSFRENVGFSAFVSVGSMLDVGWGDLIAYLGDDPATKSILVYMESIGDARGFLSAARYVAREKPIIVIKAGRTAQAAMAAASHTGTMAGSDDVLSAAFRRTGVLRVDSIADLFYMAEVLAKQPRPRGNRLTVLTNAGGPGVLATDALIGGGGELARLSDPIRQQLDEILPPAWSRGNPVDVLGDADQDRYLRALDITAHDEESDGLLVILTPQDMTDPSSTAEAVAGYVQKESARLKKPVIASWMGGSSVSVGEDVLNRAGIPTFAYPDTAARVFNYMWRYSYNLRALYETPALPELGGADEARAGAEALIRSARDDGRTLLTEFESKQLLESYGIPTVETRLAQTADEAIEQAEAIGYPVVLKLHSYTITHKTDVGGVQLNLSNADAVRRAFDEMRARLTELDREDGFDGVTVQKMAKLDGYELIVGSSVDAQFGPVLLFGSGGTLVEVYQDRALALPPLTTTLARRMMEQTKIYRALQGVRGRSPVDLDALEKLLVRFSYLVVEQPMIKEIDINPLLASSDRLLALDARVVLHEPDVTEESLPKLAIRPYPHRYASPWTLKDGTEVLIRPIRPEDEPAIAEFHRSLSEESVYLRYANTLKLNSRVAHERLVHLCFIDYDREMALVAEIPNGGESAAANAPVEHEDGSPASITPDGVAARDGSPGSQAARNTPAFAGQSGSSDDAGGQTATASRIIGVGRLTKIASTSDGEFAIVVSDRYQNQGLGTELLRRLVGIGEDEGLSRIVADILRDNAGMQRVSRALGFEIIRSDDPSDATVTAVRKL